jgi:hypothetical protein
VCPWCGTPSATVHDGAPWCCGCGHYLVHDDVLGGWTTFADREYRRRTANIQRRVAASAEQVHRAVATVSDRLPAGWHAAARHRVDGAVHTLDIAPPAGSVDAVAYVAPSPAGDGWLVRVHNRARGIDFPIYRAGGAQVASFSTAGEAVVVAVQALRIEIVDAAHR